ncbi:LysR substrate-binding domain-containing protein [Catenuloplanes japonicus]|uniref:LysR substrate-binding domain-containing protein n=1 Tax=Catenuloplanes japonicus TaxID=33876 RepID=UPI0038BC4D26
MATEGWVRFRRTSKLDEYLARLLDDTETSPHIVASATQITTAVRLAAQGLGVTVVPASAVPERPRNAGPSSSAAAHRAGSSRAAAPPGAGGVGAARPPPPGGLARRGSSRPARTDLTLPVAPAGTRHVRYRRASALRRLSATSFRVIDGDRFRSIPLWPSDGYRCRESP